MLLGEVMSGLFGLVNKAVNIWSYARISRQDFNCKQNLSTTDYLTLIPTKLPGLAKNQMPVVFPHQHRLGHPWTEQQK